jgi:Major capsid protein Gp23
MNIKSILNESAGFEKVLRKEAKGLVAKWKKTGLLEGISSEIEISNMAQLLENQAKQLVTEASATTIGTNGEEWNGVALPLVRRIFSEIAAKEFVSVQPMNLPSGLIFYLDFKYGTNQPGFTTGSGKDSQADSVFGLTETANQASGGLYGAGRFGYTINDDTTSNISTKAAAPTSTAMVTASITAADYNYDTAWSASTAGGVFQKLTFSTASFTRPDLEGVRAFTISGTNILAAYPQFTVVNSTDTQISFIVRVTSATGATDATIRYQKQPTDAARGDFETTKSQMAANPETDLDIPELNIEMRSVPIVAKTRKLKAQWTPEFAQDLNAYHSIDAEAELTSMLSEYVSQEIDFEILDMLIQNALTTGYWSARIGQVWNGSAFVQDVNLAGQAYIQGTWFATFGTVLQRVSNQIHAKTMRGGANFIVCSPDVATVLESIPGYIADGTGAEREFAFGLTRVGSFAQRYKVYKNPYMQENLVLMGYKGTQFLETGAVYAPYIPLIMTPLVYDYKNFTPRKGVMTRYAKEMVRGEFYGKVYVNGLETISGQ